MKPKSDKNDPADEISAAELTQIVGLSERRLRQLAAGGILPRPKRGVYPLRHTLEAWIEHQRGLLDNRADLYFTERALLTQARRKLAEQQLAVAQKKLRPVDVVNAETGLIMRTLNAVLWRKLVNELPHKWCGLTVEQMSERGKELHAEICRVFRSHDTWRSPGEAPPAETKTGSEA